MKNRPWFSGRETANWRRWPDPQEYGKRQEEKQIAQNS
jgi:hypothetical protein